MSRRISWIDQRFLRGRIWPYSIPPHKKQSSQAVFSFSWQAPVGDARSESAQCVPHVSGSFDPSVKRPLVCSYAASSARTACERGVWTHDRLVARCRSGGEQDKTRRSRVLGGDQDTADGCCAVPARTIHLAVEPGKPNANLLAERGTAYRSSMTPAGDLTASAADGSAPETFLSATRSSM